MLNWCMDRLKRVLVENAAGDFHIEIKKGAMNSNFTCQRVDNEFTAILKTIQLLSVIIVIVLLNNFSFVY